MLKLILCLLAASGWLLWLGASLRARWWRDEAFRAQAETRRAIRMLGRAVKLLTKGEG